MVNKTFIALLLVLLLLAAGAPGLAQAPETLRVTASRVSVDFPVHIYFEIEAAGSRDITDIRLHYRVEHMSLADVTSEAYLPFVPAPQVRAQWDWDMRRSGGLPPGTVVHYWWTVTDASGESLTTVPETVTVMDERYQWLEIEEGAVTLYWYRGDDAFAAELMNATQQALARIKSFTGAVPDRQIKFYVYGNSTDLRGSMIFPQEWTGGVAFTDYSTVAIGIAPSNLEWGRRAIAHELTHLVIHQITFSPYGDLPVWLDEGLAMNAEGALEDAFLNALSQAVSRNRLHTLRTISSPFSADSNESVQAYAESQSVVQLLVAAYGEDKMFALLKTFKEGSTYDDALVSVYGFDMAELNRVWQDSLR